MRSICVLMSTYNGEKYLSEQIDSILKQEGVDVMLVIRDDGSKDKTKQILRDYSEQNNNIIVLHEENVGCKQSFYDVSEYGFKHFINCDYFAFADQDDYWKPEKLKRGIDALEKENNNNKPLLYFTPTTIVDSNLQKINKQWPTNNLLTFEEACLIQPCAGCTMVFNREALKLFLLGKTEYMDLHDSWIYKTVLACGGKVIEDDKSYILYRQHGNNVVGGNQSKFQTWKRRFNNFIENRKGRSNRVKYILNTYGDYMQEENKKSARLIANYQNNVKDKIKLLSSDRFKTNRRTTNLLFIISVIFNRF